MRNLKEETLEVLAENGKTINDVQWVGNGTVCFDLDDFWKVIDRDYYSGYGAQNIDPKLKIGGYKWWLERAEYDGSEWWEFKTYPIIPYSIVPIRSTRDIGTFEKEENFV